ncbi:hypothetical protein MG293_000986 [Ovis ammon polii]|uniref:Uncharacterized protein n=1 Tax=Ovis ammon polii TaxID=230172 RepID=A0AAD4UNW0_OVIAM|nr:hypothetical protein MG293_000986 [Ovis ammon polii]
MELRRGLLKEKSCNLPDSIGTLNVKLRCLDLMLQVMKFGEVKIPQAKEAKSNWPWEDQSYSSPPRAFPHKVLNSPAWQKATGWAYSKVLATLDRQCIKVKSEREVTQLYPTLNDPMDCSPPGSCIYGIFQVDSLPRTSKPLPLLRTRAENHENNKDLTDTEFSEEEEIVSNQLAITRTEDWSLFQSPVKRVGGVNSTLLAAKTDQENSLMVYGPTRRLLVRDEVSEV